jgi:hypothetical protein
MWHPAVRYKFSNNLQKFIASILRQKNEMSAEKRWYEYRDRDFQDTGSKQTNRSKKSKKICGN